MGNDTKKAKVFKLMIGLFIGLLVIGYGWTRNSPNTTDSPLDNEPRNTPAAQTGSSSTAFEQAVYDVMRGFSEQDADILNRLISDDIGLVVLFRRGVYDTYDKVARLDFKKPVPEYWQYPDDTYEHTLIRYESLPAYSCDTESWDKTGLYCDTVTIDNLLSRTAENLVRYEGDVVNITDEDIRSYKELERNSRRVVLSAGDKELIFYLTAVNGKWYFTILDRVTSDCSA
ncbi:MAG: hypothetical protein LBG19_08165 [Prevotellaceae bacterium]|jgi:hypothetical protein|nr:hypothetical protein [Prevotellaceae bacterium]